MLCVSSLPRQQLAALELEQSALKDQHREKLDRVERDLFEMRIELARLKDAPAPNDEQREIPAKAVSPPEAAPAPCQDCEEALVLSELRGGLMK